MRRTFIFIFFCWFLLLSMGCDAFARKFTRKKKKDKEAEVELVLAPQEYPAPKMSKEDVYRQCFLFWKSWHGEMIETLNQGAVSMNNHKKQVSTAKEALVNLEELRKLLKPEAQAKLDVYIGKMKDLQGMIADDPYGSNLTSARIKAEDLRRHLIKDFSYNKIKGQLL